MQKLSFKLQALLLLASILLLSSCMVNHARIYEHAIEYEAVKVAPPHTCYRQLKSGCIHPLKLEG